MNLPRFHVTSIERRTCAGRYEPSPWIQRGVWGWLRIAAGEFVRGRWTRLRSIERTAEFRPDDPAALAQIAPAASCEVLDDFWGPLAALVFDRSRRWERTRFEAADAVVVP